MQTMSVCPKDVAYPPVLCRSNTSTNTEADVKFAKRIDACVLYAAAGLQDEKDNF